MAIKNLVMRGRIFEIGFLPTHGLSIGAVPPTPALAHVGASVPADTVGRSVRADRVARAPGADTVHKTTGRG